VRNFNRPVYFIILTVMIALFILTSGIDLITEWMWFEAFGYQSAFLTIILTEWGIRLATGIFLFSAFFINLFITLKVVKAFLNNNVRHSNDNVIHINGTKLGEHLTPKRIIYIYAGISALLAFMFSAIAAGEWQTVQKFLNPVEFGINDPVFNRDASFYVFKMPFYQLIHSLLTMTAIFSAIMTGAIYFLTAPRELIDFQYPGTNQPRIHMAVLVVLILLLTATGYQLSAYGLLFSTTGVIFGAGFTDITAKLPVYHILTILSLIAALVIVAGAVMKMRKLVFGAVGILVISSIFLGGIVPALVERFMVVPNQFAREQEYLEHNIAFTRYGYNLNDIEDKEFKINNTFSPEFLTENAATLNNVRLWDWRPLRQTYDQLQGLRTYYSFNQVNIDRYSFNGDYRQVMLGARELDQAKLPERAQTWQNLKLRYTHGYGLVMSPVNAVTPGGQPEFFIRDIPPRALPKLGMQIDQPEIYFGELTRNYVVVNSQSEEFSYPAGEENVYTHYAGQGGVKLDTFVKKLLYAYKFQDFRLLLSSELTPESRLLFDRDIETMVLKIAPFLQFDQEPYLVLSEGRLYWIRDGYTSTNRLPYFEPTRGWGNYVRNSVKVVIDAYEGEVSFYISDLEDPLISSYSKIFPGMFKPLDDMPIGLQAHIRYPVNLFAVQANILSNYHMENTRVFYNREDAWNIPEESGLGNRSMMDPYYTVIQLPGEAEPEYILMLPYTPQNRRNMVAWFAARNDGDNYGQLILYRFPKEELVYGPAQINARIEQDSDISQQLTLWDQRGSQVFRGNMMVLPVGESVLYVVPLFMQAEQSNIPELRRVIVAYEELIVMEETLEKALAKIFTDEELPPEGRVPELTDDSEVHEQEEIVEAERPSAVAGSLEELIKKANETFDEAQRNARSGNWAEYGKKSEELQDILRQLEELSQ